MSKTKPLTQAQLLEAARHFGSLGGKKITKKKSAQSRINGRKGGRPKKNLGDGK